MVDKRTIYDFGKYPVERIGLGFCRMNCFEWDEELFGPAPDGWDKLSDTERYEHPIFRGYCKIIDDILPEKMQSMYWWTIKLKKTYEEWEEWYNDPKSVYLRKEINALKIETEIRQRFHSRKSYRKSRWNKARRRLLKRIGFDWTEKIP